MKIFAFSDLHSGPRVLPILDNFLDKQKFDLALIAGDLTNPDSQALSYVTALNEIFAKHHQKWLCVHGNNDRGEVIDFLRRHQLDLHYEPHTLGGYNFIGLGGWGNELPPYELKFDPKTIFVTHVPPNSNPRKTPPPKSAPLLHLAGHIHAWQKYYDLGSTRVVNLPSIKFTQKAAILTLPERTVTFINLPTPKIYIGNS